MSVEQAWLSVRLEGPLQSWGVDSQYNRRATGLMPTKSAVAGMCCAAVGADRGSDREGQILSGMAQLHMLCVAIPRRIRDRDLEVRRLQDYHTVQGTTRAADGKPKGDCVLTQRLYLTDAGFGVVLTGDRAFIEELADALRDPKWGLWLGRKTCIPTAPVLVGVFPSQAEALKPLLGDRPLADFTRQEEVESFADGRDSLPDQPLSFLSSKREFTPRRVRTIQGCSPR
jgi:CRISPR system Cascade subunit CasD